jgi:hypothetical protein
MTERLLNAPVLRVVVRHVKDLQACARDQRAAMQELREGIVRPPPIMEADRQD